jgi:hypothetical protein
MSTFRLTPRAPESDTPVVIRLQAALKAFRRCYGPVAVGAVEVSDFEIGKTPASPAEKAEGDGAFYPDLD